ncbi:glycosyltransferase [Candidatus Bathyarchaeota archaeon]|nr:glycosyltransferase [Candidatus Bathyarchaeota archaeon]
MFEREGRYTEEYDSDRRAWKNCSRKELINSTSRINTSLEAYFLIVGEGSIFPKLNLAEKWNLRNIKLLGEVRDAVMFHQVCDILLTSTGERLSTSLQKTIVTGSVPVAVSGCGCPELIQNGWNGYLFKPRDFGDLADIYLA